MSDAAANHPIVLDVLEMPEADERLVNEAFGWATRCATQAAAHKTDYIVSIGTARQLANGRYEQLLAAALFAGYMTKVVIEQDGREREALKLVEEEDLFHMILRAEQDWNAQRKRDLRDPDLLAPVRLRDGDACRYCGKSVSWSDRTSSRGATYDHLRPGKAGHLVVCCKGCNSRRKNDPEGIWEPLPAPTKPLLGPESVAYLKKYGIAVEPSYTRTEAAPVELSASADRAPGADSSDAGRDRPSLNGLPETVGSPPNAVEIAAQVETVAGSMDSQEKSQREGVGASTKSSTRPRTVLAPESGHVAPEAGHGGSGRDGTGRVGSGREPRSSLPPDRSSKRKRRRNKRR